VAPGYRRHAAPFTASAGSGADHFAQGAIVEPTRLLSAHEIADRIGAYAYFRCCYEPALAIPDKAS
jgi:hypothetical protein